MARSLSGRARKSTLQRVEFRARPSLRAARNRRSRRPPRRRSSRMSASTPTLPPTLRVMNQTDSPITAPATSIRHRLDKNRTEFEAGNLVAQDLQHPERCDHVGDGERGAEAEHTEGPDEEHGQHDVDQVLDDVHLERRLGVLVRVEAAQDEEIDREGAEAEREAAECTRRVECPFGAVLAVLQRQTDQRLDAARTGRCRPES